MCVYVVTASATNKTAIREAGGIEAVIAGMRAHGSVAGVQEQGCGVLSSLAFDGA